MDAPKAAVRLSVLAAVGLLVAMTLVSLSEPGRPTPTPVTARDGSPFLLVREEGVYPAAWGPRQEPVLVVVTRQEVLDGVERIRGEGEATEAERLGEGLAVFAVSARSNRNGCSGSFVPSLGAAKDVADYDGDGAPDGRFMEACHHGQWDLFNRGAAIAATPTCGPLAMLPLQVAGTQLRSRGFDREVGGQWCDQ